MSGLGGERERWTAEAARLRGSFGAITGDMLLAAGAVAYLGAFTMPYRCAYLQQGLATGHVVMAVACSVMRAAVVLGLGAAGLFSRVAYTLSCVAARLLVCPQGARAGGLGEASGRSGSEHQRRGERPRGRQPQRCVLTHGSPGRPSQGERYTPSKGRAQSVCDELHARTE